MTVFLIALAHGLPIVITRLITKSRVALAISAAVMAVVAVVTGSSFYTYSDLFAVVTFSPPALPI